MNEKPEIGSYCKRAAVKARRTSESHWGMSGGWGQRPGEPPYLRRRQRKKSQQRKLRNSSKRGGRKTRWDWFVEVKGRAGSWWWGALPKDSDANREAGVVRMQNRLLSLWLEDCQNYRESILLRCQGQRANSFHGLRIVSAGAEKNMRDEIRRTPYKDRKFLSTFIDWEAGAEEK